MGISREAKGQSRVERRDMLNYSLPGGISEQRCVAVKGEAVRG